MNLKGEIPSGARSNSGDAFTIIELLTILAVVALLFFLHLSALASAKDQTLRGQCSSRLRQVVLATQIMGNENNDRLPANNSTFWAWDMSWNVGNAYTQYVALQTMYCPASGFNYDDNSRLWNYGIGSVHVIGYAQTFQGTTGISSTNWNITLTPQRVPVGPGFTAVPSASQRVLFADPVISAVGQANPALVSTYNWTNIAGAYPKHHRTCHMDGALPAGGNVGMLDGHVEWRSFSQMQSRTPITSSAPDFWW